MSSTRVAAAVGAAGIVVAALMLSWMARTRPPTGSTLNDGPRVTVPSGMRVTVQILNGSGVSGLAVRATRYLRDRGFDVVTIGNTTVRTDSTFVISRTGRDDWAVLVARALGVASIRSEPDSTLYVDVTVVLGKDWSPAPDPLRP